MFRSENMKKQNAKWDKSQQGAYGLSVIVRPTKMILVLLFTVISGVTVSAQNRGYNPYEAERAYYEAFNRRTERVYRAARSVDRASRYVVNYGSRAVRGGSYVRRGYNAARNYVQRNVGLPRRYRY